MPDGTFEFSGSRGGFNIVAQKNKALEPYGKCIWNYRGRRKPRPGLPSGKECCKQSDPEQLVVRRSWGNYTRAWYFVLRTQYQNKYGSMKPRPRLVHASVARGIMAWCWNWFLEKNSLLSISRLETQDLHIITICMSVRNITIYIKKHSQSASIRKITSRN